MGKLMTSSCLTNFVGYYPPLSSILNHDKTTMSTWTKPYHNRLAKQLTTASRLVDFCVATEILWLQQPWLRKGHCTGEQRCDFQPVA